MKNILKKAGIIGISSLCAFTAANVGNSAASIQNGKIRITGIETRQVKKIYKYKQDKKQVKEFNSIKADFNSLDMVIEKSESKNFYISYNLNCNNSSNPLSYKVENGVLSIKESGLKWPAGYVYISGNGKKSAKVNYKDYNNKIYVYIPSGTNLKNYNLNTRSGDLFIKNISMESGNIIAESGDIDITVPGISGSVDINTGSGDIDINTDRNTKINTDINGQLNINTGSGDVDIKRTAINKTFKIKTGSGDININADINGQANVNTGSGDVDINKSVINKIFDIKTSSGDVGIYNSSIKGKLAIQTSSGDIDTEYMDISGNADIKTSSGDVDIKSNIQYIDKFGINMITKDGDMYIKKAYKGTKRKKGDGYEYTRNKNKKPLLSVMVTGWGDIELR